MKNYDKNIEPLNLDFLDANNLLGWIIPQKLFVNGFKQIKKWSEFGEKFIKDLDKNSNKGCFLEVVFVCP